MRPRRPEVTDSGCPRRGDSTQGSGGAAKGPGNAKRVRRAWTGQARRRRRACVTRWRELERRRLREKREDGTQGNTFDGQIAHTGPGDRLALCNSTSSVVSCSSCSPESPLRVVVFSRPTSGPEKGLPRASRICRPKCRRGAEGKGRRERPRPVAALQRASRICGPKRRRVRRGKVGGKDPSHCAPAAGSSPRPRLLTALVPPFGLDRARSEAETQSWVSQSSFLYSEFA
jgi:hypothetical protein